MKTTTITEFVTFSLQENTTSEELVSRVNNLNAFQENLDGYLDAELVKDTGNNVWCIIYHYESMEKVQAIGPQIRTSKAFGEMMSLMVPGSLKVTFNLQMKAWQTAESRQVR
jgi:hypothetical protein